MRVIAAVIERDGRLLVCQRPLHKRHGGLWEFPGGKLEPNEDDAAAARRELREELGLELEAIETAELEVQDPASPYLIAFAPVLAHGEPVCHEHTAVAWGTPAELSLLPLAPADRSYIEYCLTR
jgi:mutator protein MutT